MSAVKIKNAIVRAIAAAGIEDLMVTAELKQGRIRVEVIKTNFDCFTEGVLRYDAHGNVNSMTMALEFGQGRPKYLTDKAWELEQRLKQLASDVIVAHGATGGISVLFSWPVAHQQAQRRREAAQVAA